MKGRSLSFMRRSKEILEYQPHRIYRKKREWIYTITWDDDGTCYDSTRNFHKILKSADSLMEHIPSFIQTFHTSHITFKLEMF